jgi:serine protease Do
MIIRSLVYVFISIVTVFPIFGESSLKNGYISSFADIIEPLMPTVVNVYTTCYPKKSGHNKMNSFANLPEPWSKFFDSLDVPFNDLNINPKSNFLGSGVIISSDGYILTNHHVIKDADEVSIKLSNNTEYPAKVIGFDQGTDLALLKIESKILLVYAKFGDSNKSRIGDIVIAIGNPFGLGGTVTTGIISSKGRDLNSNGSLVDDFIQTDAAINSGNSGGPMFNINGEVIGINTAIISPSGTNAGIGFAIPSNTASKVIDQLKKHGKITRGLLKIKIQDLTQDISEAMDLKVSSGVLVSEVEKDGPADKAGMKIGDVIVKINNIEIKNVRKLQIAISEMPINKELFVTVIRNGKTMALKCKMIDANAKIVDKDRGNKIKQSVGSFEYNGVIFKNITEDWSYGDLKQFSAGVYVDQVSSSSMWKYLTKGDVILSVNQIAIDSVDDIAPIIKKATNLKKKHIVMLIKRGSSNIVLAVPL